MEKMESIRKAVLLGYNLYLWRDFNNVQPFLDVETSIMRLEAEKESQTCLMSWNGLTACL